MHFTDDSAYDELKREKEGDFDIVVLPKRSTLYRTSRRGVPTASTSPVFLGDWTMVTSFYGNKGGERRTLFQYTTAKPAKLMVMTLASLKALAAGDDASFVREYYVDPRTTFSPEVFKRVPGPTGKLGQKPETPVIIPDKETGRGYEDYVNRQLATLVCARGFDGWIVVPNSVVEYAPEDSNAYIYSAEVMLCPGAGDPLEIVNYGKLKGGRRTTKTGRRVRKGTRRGRTVRS